jgi:hypothetical protein
LTRAKHSPVYVTKDLMENRYKGAQVIFLAGSVMRGEASTYSDIDIVVVYPKIERAYRESFFHLEWPVEAFVHDPETLRYFIHDVDRPQGSSTLAEMVFEGLETPAPTPFSEALKKMASEVLHLGPPALTEHQILDRRYHISELVDDIREPRTRQELNAAACSIYSELADYFFRSRGQFSSVGKAILKRMKRSDAAFFRRFTEAFDLLFATGRAEKVIELAEELLAPQGGMLFDGYRRDVPANWRLPSR